MTNPFDLILGAVAPVAPTAPRSTAFASDAVAPSEGFVLPVAPRTITLFPYQVAGVEAILAGRRIILGHQPGMGKTAIAQAAIAAIVAEGRVIVVVPPSLRVDPWAKAFAADYPHLRVTMVEGTKPAPIDAADVAIVGDSVIAARLDDLLAFGAVAVVADEAHRFKSVKAKRSQALKAIADTVSTVVPMTGTLAVNRPDEIYMPIRIAGSDVARKVSGGGGYNDFVTAWCITEPVYIPSLGRTIQKVVGAKDAPALHRRLRETCYVRVARDLVLDLPNHGWSVHSLTLNGSMSTYRRMERDFIAWVRAAKGDKAAGRARKAEAVTKMMALWQEAGRAKVGATVEYVSALIEQGEPVVIMAWHTSVIDGLAEAFPDAAVIKGGLSSDRKSEITADFQAGRTNVLIGQIEAAGTGITLHKAAHLVFAQLPWSPGVLVQAAERIFR